MMRVAQANWAHQKRSADEDPASPAPLNRPKTATLSPVQVSDFNQREAESKARYALGINCDEPLADFVIQHFRMPHTLYNQGLPVKLNAIAKLLVREKKKLDGVCDPFSRDGMDHGGPSLWSQASSQDLGGFTEQAEAPGTPHTPENGAPPAMSDEIPIPRQPFFAQMDVEGTARPAAEAPAAATSAAAPAPAAPQALPQDAEEQAQPEMLLKALTASFPPNIPFEERIPVTNEGLATALIKAQVEAEARGTLGKELDCMPYAFYNVDKIKGPYSFAVHQDAGEFLLELGTIVAADASGGSVPLKITPMIAPMQALPGGAAAGVGTFNAALSDMRNNSFYLEIFYIPPPGPDSMLDLGNIPKLAAISKAVAGLGLDVISKRYVDVKGNAQVEWTADKQLVSSGGDSLGIKSDKLNLTVKPKPSMKVDNISWPHFLEVPRPKGGTIMLRYNIGAAENSIHRKLIDAICRKGCKQPLKGCKCLKGQDLYAAQKAAAEKRKLAAAARREAPRGQPPAKVSRLGAQARLVAEARRLAGEEVDSNVECTYYASGMCTKGLLCKYTHDGALPAPSNITCKIPGCGKIRCIYAHPGEIGLIINISAKRRKPSHTKHEFHHSTAPLLDAAYVTPARPPPTLTHREHNKQMKIDENKCPRQYHFLVAIARRHTHRIEN